METRPGRWFRMWNTLHIYIYVCMLRRLLWVFVTFHVFWMVRMVRCGNWGLNCVLPHKVCGRTTHTGECWYSIKLLSYISRYYMQIRIRTLSTARGAGWPEESYVDSPQTHQHIRASERHLKFTIFPKITHSLRESAFNAHTIIIYARR